MKGRFQGWQVVWAAIPRIHGEFISENWFLLKSSAIDFGNTMSNKEGWGPFCVRRYQKKEVAPPIDFYTGICE